MTKSRRRRAKGEGSIEQLPNGHFRAVATVGRDPTSGRQRKESKTFTTQREAVSWLRTRQKEKRGEWARESLSKWLDHWLALKKPDVEPATLAYYEQRVRRFLKPYLGSRPLGDLEPIDVRKARSDMERDGHTAGEQRRAMKTLRSALEDAVRLEQIGRNVARLVKLPKVVRREMQCLNRSQAVTLMQTAAGDNYEALYVLALDPGMRPGELFGLHWPDVDLTAGAVFVRQSVEYLAGAVRLKEPKTRASRRRIPISPRTGAALQAHWERMRHEGWDAEKGPVFIDGGGLIRHPNFRERFFLPMLARADVPAVRLYDLRHTSATLLLAAGVNLKVVSQRLGHEDVAITLRHYAHALPCMQEQVAAVVQAIFDPTAIPRREEDDGPSLTETLSLE